LIPPRGRLEAHEADETRQGARLDLDRALPHNAARGKRIVPLNVGILIIGSLYWEDDRQAWRDDRLRIENSFEVSAPIRYGRISETRGNTYTMVFARGCAPGQAKAVPCQQEIGAAHDLATEAEHLWAAERREPLNGRISANWGCVVLLANPRRAIPTELLNGWAARVRRARPYGNIRQAPGEGELVNERGMLQIAWPTSTADNRPLALDFLLATATQPNLARDPPWYPTQQMIAARWRADTAGHGRYFRNNVRNGIRTFEDDAIALALDAPA
jgi:hypothetical protein